MNTEEFKDFMNSFEFVDTKSGESTNLGDAEVIEIRCDDFTSHIKSDEHFRCSDKPKLIDELEDATEEREYIITKMYKTRTYLKELMENPVYREDEIRKLWIEATLGIDDASNEECFISKIEEIIDFLNKQTIPTLDKVLESKEMIEELKKINDENAIKKIRKIAETKGLI